MKKSLIYLFLVSSIIIYGLSLNQLVNAQVAPEFTITSINKPDLDVENVTLDPTIAWTGEFDRTVVVYFLIRNLGGVEARMDNVRHNVYRADTGLLVGHLVIDDSFDVLYPGYKRVYKIVIPREIGLKDKPGKYTLRLDADVNNRVSEDFIANNTNSATLIVNPGRPEDYPDGYVCSVANCAGTCIDNVCNGNSNYVCSSANCAGTCIDNICQQGISTCNANNCSGLCINDVCYNNICNANNCTGTCVNNICQISYVCGPDNCNGTCKDNVCYSSAPPGECEPFSYGRCRINLLEEKKSAKQLRRLLEQELQTDNIPLSSTNWYTIINSFIYGGYPVKAIGQAIKLGGKTVHPSIHWNSWRTTDDYKNNIYR